MKQLADIFINTKGNKLRLAKVCFSDKIKEIKFLSDEIDWVNVKDKSSLNEFKANHNSKEKVDDIIDGKFNLLMPGAIDPHVHFNTPGFESREDFRHASTAAVFGGVTTIIDMPCTSIPPVTDIDNLAIKLDAVKSEGLIDYAFWGGIRGQDFIDLDKLEQQVMKLSNSGVAGFKVYVTSGMNDFADLSYDQIKIAAQIVKKTGKPLAVHAEDKSMVVSRREVFQKANRNSWKDYCAARDDEAEITAVEKLKEIAELTGCKIHIVHLSSKKGIEIIRAAKTNNISLTAETCPHYLYFTQSNFENESIRNYLKTAPPVKNKLDKDALWQALKNNELEFVTTDHAGCNPFEEKTSDNFWEVYGGIPGVEHRVPFLFSEGFLKNRIDLEQTINYLSTNVADFFKLTNKGKLEKDYDSDFALIDLWQGQKVSNEGMHSKGKYTPFHNKTFDAIVDSTYLRGVLIMDRNTNFFGEFGYGQFSKI